MRFQQYLTEARDTTKGKGVTWEQIKDIEKQLSRALRPDMTQKITSTKIRGEEAWDLDFRVYDLFTERPGEEDDDWPDFTGAKQLDKILKQLLKGIGYEVHPSEKYWLSIIVKAKKLTKKEQRVDNKKRTDLVTRKVKWKEIDQSGQYEKEMYNSLLQLLKKQRNKFITKQQFTDLAKKSSFRFDNDDIEETWRDIE